MIPDGSQHKAEPRYIRELVDACEMRYEDVAAALGVTDRTLRNYTSPTSGIFAPYSVQFCLEVLAASK